ncbi:TerC family protein [Mucilaginibacter phyllosphaerae]|uniref:Tellurium resistance membrane protein TerC n=1 Tax=Mucilaginibacter phyllosphaerae TaxID=1812349 RepID=A0A4Y8A5N7_9SPHI|nr:TerC family protein [Mucilaginibacter phyllosphaerae]MBB3971021.1 putative tellurium resistance membrane protein TerC [Mucilaginibacter phyllosphaerae]TEW63764.1 TerC family protein [Mucilaginibacter phyllosphaerae]
MEILTDPEAWVSLITLTVLEIVLGIDNVIFISILSDKLPKNQQERGRKVGLGMAMITRILLLLTITWVMKLTAPLFNIAGLVGATDPEWVKKLAISGRDLILIIGGLFLIYKSTAEIHHKIEGDEDDAENVKPHSFWGTIFQIMLLDIVFSLDSVITAVGMAQHVEIMIAAVVIAVGIMMWASGSVAKFVNTHPTVKMLALSFLLLIGVSLLAEAFEQHIPKGYIYFAMAFSILVEMLNLKMKAKREKRTKAAIAKKAK